jgi:hypothetical protein
LHVAPRKREKKQKLEGFFSFDFIDARRVIEG